ncbi:MAG: hypothetical protein GY822_14475 [Deltaproteobacteria bacterium]|nr:hypothetical protein [Deltaproteobacteria bacterium]
MNRAVQGRRKRLDRTGFFPVPFSWEKAAGVEGILCRQGGDFFLLPNRLHSRPIVEQAMRVEDQEGMQQLLAGVREEASRELELAGRRFNAVTDLRLPEDVALKLQKELEHVAEKFFHCPAAVCICVQEESHDLAILYVHLAGQCSALGDHCYVIEDSSSSGMLPFRTFVKGQSANSQPNKGKKTILNSIEELLLSEEGKRDCPSLVSLLAGFFPQRGLEKSLPLDWLEGFDVDKEAEWAGRKLASQFDEILEPKIYTQTFSFFVDHEWDGRLHSLVCRFYDEQGKLPTLLLANEAILQSISLASRRENITEEDGGEVPADGLLMLDSFSTSEYDLQLQVDEEIPSSSVELVYVVA